MQSHEPEVREIRVNGLYGYVLKRDDGWYAYVMDGANDLIYQG